MLFTEKESSTLEFKQELPKNNQIVKTIIGFKRDRYHPAFIKKNIPVHLNFSLCFKESLHNFFRQRVIVTIFTFLPAFFFGKYKKLAMLIRKCHTTFSEFTNQMQIKIYGGDRLKTLLRFEKKLLEDNGDSKQLDTTLNFSKRNSLATARTVRKILKEEDQNERIGILNMANRRQPGGVGLAPYGGSQEEFLVRRSNLAWGIDPRFKSEDVHNQLRQIRLNEGYPDYTFSHHIPYFGAVISKNVCFINKKSFDYFDVISAAAPDMRKGSDEYIRIQKCGDNAKTAQLEILENKIKAIFEAAISENIENLVIGAFGCGCFQNDSKEVAEVFSKVLKLDAFRRRFHYITFAITDKSKLNIFREILSRN